MKMLLVVFMYAMCAVALAGCSPALTMINHAGIPMPLEYQVEKSSNPPMVIEWAYAYMVPVTEKSDGIEEKILRPTYIPPERISNRETISIPEDARSVNLITFLRNERGRHHQIKKIENIGGKKQETVLYRGIQKNYQLIVEASKAASTAEVRELGIRVEAIDFQGDLSNVFEPESLIFRTASRP